MNPKTVLIAAVAMAGALTGSSQDLQLRVTLPFAADLGVPASSVFNPRYFDGDIYLSQVNVGTMGSGRYPSGWPVASLLVNNSAAGPEHRMVAPFRGANKSKYLLGSSSGASLSTTMSRYDYDGSNRVDVATPFALTVEGFDWVDDDTVIGSIYTSGNRKRIYLMDVTAEPFALNLNTTWNPNGYVTSGVSTRIRNVRVGDIYRGYAYYGDSGQNSNPNFYALSLATGAETLLGNAGTLTGSGSFGIWTVLERGGLLYVQTTDNGIQVYSLTDATTLGTLVASYAKLDIDSVTGYAGQYYGLDVSPDRKTFVLGAAGGQAFEFGPPQLGISRLGATDVILSWPAAVNAVLIQSSASLAPADFRDLDPQPVSWSDGKFNNATTPIGPNQEFFRLRRGP